MWLTTVSIRRPLLILTVLTTFMVIGLVAWSRLGVDLFPALDFPIVVVNTPYPGAGPEEVDSLVSARIEDAVAGLSGLDYVQASSIEGLSSVVVHFTERAPSTSTVDVERQVAAIRGDLPAEVQAPSISKYDPNAQPVLLLAATGPDLGRLQQLADDKIRPRLHATDGVGDVRVIGGLQREIQVRVDQHRLQAHSLSILQVNQALAVNNVNLPAGSVVDQGKDWNIRLDSLARQPTELKDIALPSNGRTPIYLRDVATVVDTYKKVSTIQRSDGNPALGITVARQAAANTIETAEAVKHILDKLKAELPPDVQIRVISDASVFTRNSLNDVTRELAQAVLLTGLVLLVFLHTFRSTLIVLLAIPTSLIATLGVMYFLGLSLNMMSLMGLTLSVGILVDDSIVVLENIFRHLQEGEDARTAAVNGRSEIGFAAIAITLVDVVVFAPIAFMSGITGQYFRQFGLVIVSATLFSLFVSFTLTPLLASRWYRHGEHGDDASPRDQPARSPLALLGRVWDSAFLRLTSAYGVLLRTAIGHRVRWLVVASGLMSFVGGLSLVFTGLLSTEFLPDADSAQLLVNLEMPPGTALAVTDAAAQVLENRLLDWPESEQVFTSVGVASDSLGGDQARLARLQVELVPSRQRSRDLTHLAQVARTLGDDIPGATVRATIPSLVTGSTAPVQIRIEGDDPKVLSSLAVQVADLVRQTPGTVDVDQGDASGQPAIQAQIDPQRAADLGLAPGHVAGVLRAALTGNTVSRFRPDGARGWDITVMLDLAERARVDQLPDVSIVTPRGAEIRLRQIARLVTGLGPGAIDRRDQQRLVTVRAQVDGRPSGDVTRDIRRDVSQIQLPSGYSVTLAGAAEQQSQSFGQIASALALSALLMYLLMVALYESLLYPLVVMLSLPLAVVGAFGLLALTGNTLNMLSMIGLILLTGLVGKNAILLVDYTNSVRKQGRPRDDALLEAGAVRLRPILMTTSAMVLAMVPLALRLGEGSEWRAPMAITVIGGLLTSTLLTLVFIPAVYTLLDDAQTRVLRAVRGVHLVRGGRWRRRAEMVRAPGARARARGRLSLVGGSE